MSNYLLEVKNRNQSKFDEISQIKKKHEELLTNLEVLNGVVMELKANCEQGKVSQYEVERNTILIGEKRKLIESARNEVGEMEKEVWEKEIEVSRKRDTVDTVVKQINSLSIQEGLRTQTGELVCIQVNSFQGSSDEDKTASNSIRVELGEMVRTSRTNTRNKERELQAAVTNLLHAKDQDLWGKKELSSKEAELSRLLEELVKSKEQMDKEEDYYDSQLTVIKEQLHSIKSQEKVNMQELQKDLILCEENLKSVQIKRRKDLEEGKAFLRKVSEKTVNYIEQCTIYRDNAARAVFDAAKQRVEIVKKAGMEIEEKVDQALKDSKREK